MKKLLTVCLFSLLAAPGFAQDTEAQAAVSTQAIDKVDYRINQRALEKLQLTDDQQNKVRVINENYRTQMQLMIKSDIPADQRKAKRSQLNKTRTSNILAILSSKQIEKLIEIQKDVEDTDDKEYKMKSKSADGKTKIKIKQEND